jgi:hypothetical protein
MANPTPAPTTVATNLTLTLPADPQMLRIVRLVASGVASLGPLDLDAVEEVRVMADELVSTLIEASSGGSVTLDLSINGERLRLEASTAVRDGKLDVDPMTDRILDAVSSQHEWRTVDGEAHGIVERSLSS